MRRWHKMLAPWFALLLFLLALTGVATQATSLLDVRTKPAAAAVEAKPHKHGDGDMAAAPREKRSAMGAWNHWIKKLHSGEALGPVGIALNLLGGTALLFFACSGFWMYLSMWLRQRRGRRLRAR